MLSTQYGPVLYGPDFSDSEDPLIIFSDSSDLIFNSMEPNRVPKTPQKKTNVT